MTSNLFTFSRSYEAADAARRIMDAHSVEDMQWKADTLGKTHDGKSILYGFWWRGYVADEAKLTAVRDALDAAGHPWFREPEKLTITQ